MRSKTNKSVSRLVGIWTFLLLFIFKGIFPKPAYAFLSSLDACAANPECGAAISSEVAPAVSAPTGAGFSASTLSTTTAAGATSSVQAVARVAVVADTGISSVVAWHYWNQAQNEQAQEKARQKYCAAYPTDAVCLPWYEVWLGAIPFNDASDGQYNGVYYAKFRIQGRVTGYRIAPYDSDEVLMGVTNEAGNYSARRFYYSANQTYKIINLFRVDGQPDTGGDPLPLYWKDWPQEKRDEAVRLLNDSDWQGLITSMPEGGRLNPGDKINAPTIVIPGEETDDPNTPVDERILRKEPGFFTFPGLPDFDYDADGTADSADPEPQNPSVPTASSGSSGSSSDPSSNPPDSNEPLDTSQEPRPEPLSEIPETGQARDLAEAKAAELRNTLPKKDRPTATAAVVDTRTGKVYYGTSGKPLPTTIDEYLAERMPVPSEELWEVSNCAEFKAVNDALLDGANIRNLEVHTVRTRSGEAYPRCRNCRKTIDGPNVTSDP